MSDLIDRQAAIDKVDCLYRDTTNDESYMKTGYNHAVSDVLAILKTLPSAEDERIRRMCEFMSKWNITDRFINEGDNNV